MSKKGKLTRILISIIFIAIGLGFVASAVMDILDANFEALMAIDCVLGILMFVLGIMGVSGTSLKACKVVAVIVCLLAVASFVMTAISLNVRAIIGATTTTLVWALLAWIYFDLS